MAKGKNKGKGPKPGKRKISLLKLSNKKLNKLAKQGKLKKAVGKKKLVSLLKERTSKKKLDRKSAPEREEPEVENDIPLQEADYDYYAKPGRNFDFLSDLAVDESSKKLSRKKRRQQENNTNNSYNDKITKDYELNEGLYEQRYKNNNDRSKNVKIKQLLPFKSKDKGIIHRSMEIEQKSDDDEDDDDDVVNNGVDDDDVNNDDGGNDDDDGDDGNDQSNSHPPRKKSKVEEYIDEKIKTQQLKRGISNLCKSILQSIDDNIGKLNEVMGYLADEYTHFIRKYALISLFEVFNDIIPDYKIRLISDTEKKQKMKKETKLLFGTEEILLTCYKKYIEILDIFCKGQTYSSNKKLKKNNRSTSNGRRVNDGGNADCDDDDVNCGVTKDTELKNKKTLKRRSVECLGDLLNSHPQFNFRVKIITIIVRSLFNHDSKTSDIACEAVKKLFSADKVGDVTLEVIRLIGRAIKVRKFDVKPKVLDTFLSLKIKEVSRDSDNDGEGRKKMMTMEEKRKMSKMMSKRDRKRKKQMKELEKELEEAAVTDNTKHKIKMHTEIVSMVFLTYFRILKLASDSKLLSSVLAGLAKFAHLINVSYFDDLFAVLTRLVESGDLTTRESLHCIETSLTLLLGQGSAFNIDPYKFYLHLYKTLLSFNYSNANTDLPSCIKCLDLMFNKRKRHVSDQRCLAYVKRLSILSTHLSGRSAITVLSMIREIIRNYPKCEVLLDTDSIGNGKYDPESDNPDFCNAQNTSLFELNLLRSSYDPDVRTYAQHILQNCSSDGRFRLPLHLINIKSDYVEKDSLQCIGRISELKRKN